MVSVLLTWSGGVISSVSILSQIPYTGQCVRTPILPTDKLLTPSGPRVSSTDHATQSEGAYVLKHCIEEMFSTVALNPRIEFEVSNKQKENLQKVLSSTYYNNIRHPSI